MDFSVFGSLRAREAAVLASGNGDELVRHSCLVERLPQPESVAVGHARVGVAMDGENGRKPGAHVGERGGPARHRLP